MYMHLCIFTFIYNYSLSYFHTLLAALGTDKIIGIVWRMVAHCVLPNMIQERTPSPSTDNKGAAKKDSKS